MASAFPLFEPLLRSLGSSQARSIQLDKRPPTLACPGVAWSSLETTSARDPLTEMPTELISGAAGPWAF